MTEAISKEEAMSASEHPDDIRKAHIKVEASIKSVGILYYLGALFLFVSAVTGLMSEEENSRSVQIITAGIFIGFGVLQLFVGTGLRRLQSWAKIPTAILSCIGMLGFPMGTLINGYILYLVLSKKGKMVFSEDYKAVISATPGIKYKTSKIVWVFLVLLLALLALIIISIAI